MSSHHSMAINQTKNRKGGTQTHTRPYSQVREATQHHAETRDPPSQDPRDHMVQAERHNNSLLITPKQTTTTPRRNESGEKKGETDSETRANVRKTNVKLTVKPPCGCAQSPLRSAFPIIILLGNFLCSALVVLAG